MRLSYLLSAVTCVAVSIPLRLVQGQHICDFNHVNDIAESDVNNGDVKTAIITIKEQCLRGYGEFLQSIDAVEVKLNQYRTVYNATSFQVKNYYTDKVQTIEHDCEEKRENIEFKGTQMGWSEDKLSSKLEKVDSECYNAHVQSYIEEDQKMLQMRRWYEVELAECAEEMQRLTSEFKETIADLEDQLFDLVARSSYRKQQGQEQLLDQLEHQMNMERKKLHRLLWVVLLVHQFFFLLYLMQQKPMMIEPIRSPKLLQYFS
mmetsp:Transcript_8769/g.12142  ORF Transcript_8769/g.12142 Transcript_8769/m.12142 type:complete len:261 (-) Transcript_8769:296-1078(-)|eukprot:CAMPEP_0185725758 /NCGR_PEP_ID=MMETSP1171-20130828/1930_1 /TAXON_ID=374046 /ORGANISM="Helicotheca tamensis, Strain CCMP826" /LENGTH=260 /DNA_ID=CAMNT_0028393957 /DNA_START=65 /DNA_END=847 /DNA_ORIENTATION=-